jgi:hypothetical protein
VKVKGALGEPMVEAINYRTIKWIIFTTLSLTIPAMFFLVMVVMFVPAIFFVAGIGYVIPKLLKPGPANESWGFIAILGIHALVYAEIYYGISLMVAKTITMIKNWITRLSTLVALCFGLVLMTQFPIYGGGGDGPMKWFSLTEFLIDINKSYGAGTVQILYGTAILLCGILLFRKPKKNVN